ncbi:MAG: right-handed parallel beta-helix repeat-containing protein [Synergistaceae bacterium]|jgi:hypothetical protein|nr:right-handed parallel beta-helix repeat-containing protein [Synergistaceae bacterium]
MKKILISAGIGLWIFGAGMADADSFTVTSGAGNGAGSLRQAVLSANANDEEDVIDIASSVKEIALSSAIAISGNVHINGGGATIKGSQTTRLFDVSGGNVTFERLTFTGGSTTSENGGAAYIDSSAATANFINCVFFGNHAGGSGAAVYLYGGGNRPTTFTNCTITNNDAAENGGGVSVAGGVVQFTASIVTGNKARVDPDLHVSGGMISNTGWYNVMGETNASSFLSAGFYNDVSVAASDVFKTPGTLTTVDGVQVMELLSVTNNVALDKIPTANAVALPLPGTDIRGVQRPQMAAVDAGACELSPVPLTSVELQGSSYAEVYTSETYGAVLQPENVTLDVRSYTDGLYWSVSDPSILSVDQHGKAAALAVGAATLKVEAHGWDALGNAIVRESSKPVKVGTVALTSPAITALIVDKKPQMSVNDQHTLHLDLKILPEETPYTVTFESGSPAAATVTQAGPTSSSAVVKALSTGETLINVTVTAKNSKGTASATDSYILTVTERKKSGGGGCQSLAPGSFIGMAGMALTGFLLLSRRRKSDGYSYCCYPSLQNQDSNLH